jgi:hypothetical protein
MMGGREDNNSYFQRLSLCEMLQRTAVVIASDIGVFATVGFVTVGLYALVWACLLTLVLMPAFGLEADQMNDPTYLVDHIGAVYAIIFSQLLAHFLMTAVGFGALVRAVAELYVHRRPSLGALVKVGISHFFWIFLAAILGYLGSVIGIMLFILPGFYVVVNWWLVNPVIVIGKALDFLLCLESSNVDIAPAQTQIQHTRLISYHIFHITAILPT